MFGRPGQCVSEGRSENKIAEGLKGKPSRLGRLNRTDHVDHASGAAPHLFRVAIGLPAFADAGTPAAPNH